MSEVSVEYSKEHRTVDGYAQITLNPHTVYLITKHMDESTVKQTIQELQTAVSNLEENAIPTQGTIRLIWERKQIIVALQDELKYRQ